MLDNALIALIISTLQTGMTAIGQSSILIKQAWQPTQQGANTQPTVYLHKISDGMIGYPQRQDIPDQDLSAVFIGSVDGHTLTVTSVSAGTLAIGEFLFADGIPANTIIAELGSGMGGVGTYILSTFFTLGSSDLVAYPATMVHIETTQFETTFQFSALATQNPANTNQLTAADILNYARYVLQSQTAIATLESQGVGVFNVRQARNTPFTDDRDVSEYSPSFDVTFTHKQIIITGTPSLESEEIQILFV